MLKGYEKYQLEWMIEHGHSLSDLLEDLIKHYCDNQEDMTIGDAFDDWIDNVGFNGEIWSCEDEWKDNEGDMLDLNEKIFNDTNWNDFIVIEGMECYMMVVQLNSDGEVDYTVFDGTGTEEDGGVYESDNITYKELFRFAGFDMFNECSKLWEGDEAKEYIDSVM